MRRRVLLTAVAGGVTLAGCIDGTGASTEPTTTSTDPDRSPSSSPEKPKDTPTAVRKTAEGVTATFRVVDGHSPTEDTVDATFGEQQVTVTGSMDPENCNEPTLESVGYDAGSVSLVVGEYSPYGETATVECANASYDFRCVVTVNEGRPSVVEVTYDYPESEDQMFIVERD